MEQLLAKINFNHGVDTLWLVGDIVNRGPQSLACLQFCMQHESSVKIVLGNHDLHLLAVMYGYGKMKKRDTIAEIVNHPKANIMRDWLRLQSLLVKQDTNVMVHAGLLPEWNIMQAQGLAAEVEMILRSQEIKKFLSKMYGDTPNSWSPQWHGIDRLRLITNVFTRLRALTADNCLNYDFKNTLEKMPSELHAWFDAPNRQNLDHTIIFGHWSAIGIQTRNHIISLDTGAVWGGQLTAVNLHNQQFIQVQASAGLAIEE